MKLKALYSLIILAASPMLIACSNDNDNDFDGVQTEPSEETITTLEISSKGRTAVDAANEMSFSLMESIAQQSKDETNACISPVSLIQLLTLMSNGADTEGLEAILTRFNLGNGDQQALSELNELCKAFVTKLPKLDKNVTCSFSNSLWTAPQNTIKNSYSEVLNEYFKGVLINENPGGKDGMMKINSFINEKTNGLIPQFLKTPLDNGCGLALLNTIYFHGLWSAPFDTKDTRKNEFKNATGLTSNVDYMCALGNIRNTEFNGQRMVNIPFGNETYSISFILPSEGSTSFPTLAEWKALSQSLAESYIKLELPKFDIEYIEDDMIKYLPEFSELTFPNILSDNTENKEIQFNRIIHATRLSISEDGCEGAGASLGANWILGIDSPQPKAIVFNRPFYFVISEKSTNAILFMGQIQNL